MTKSENKTEKKFEHETKYSKYDLDGDGVISDKELEMDEKMMRLENEDKKQDAQRYMAWFSLWGMLLYPSGILVTAMLGYDMAANLIADIAPTYFVAISALVAAFFGATAYTKGKIGK